MWPKETDFWPKGCLARLVSSVLCWISVVGAHVTERKINYRLRFMTQEYLWGKTKTFFYLDPA